ncbi:MAG: hypothetical protein IKK99_09065 [Oscillospiraceae bacterium]|nr:hypothetical protein [Oscillospiraceae bacterium]
MSLFCICVVDIAKNNTTELYKQHLEKIARSHNRGIKFSINWDEPFMKNINNRAFIINLLDNPFSDNCEMLLLPDGWYYNGITNDISFVKRMQYIQEVVNVFRLENYNIDLYIGSSGMETDEFVEASVNYSDLINILVKTIGVDGPEEGMHIIIGT